MAGTHVMRRMSVRGVLALCGGALAMHVGGCASEEKPPLSGLEIPRAMVRVAPFDPGDRPVSEPMPLARRSVEPTKLVAQRRLSGSSSGELIEPAVIGSSVGELRRVKLSVSEARAQEVLHALLGPDGLDTDYVVDPKALAASAAPAVTMDIDEEMTPGDIRQLLDGLARLYGWTIHESGGITYVRQAQTLAKDPTTPLLEAMAAMGDQSPVMRVRRMRHILPGDVKDLLGELLSEGGKAVPVGRSLVLLDTAANVNRISRLLAALDAPSFDGVEVWTYKLGHRTPEDAVSLLDQIAAASRLGGSASQDPVVAFVAMPGTNRLMVIGRDPTVQQQVQDMIASVDQPPDYPVRHRYLYRIQYYEPSALLAMVNSFFSDRIESASAIGGAGTQGQPGAGGLGLSPGQSRAPVGTGMRLTLDPGEDLMLIQATPDDFADLVSTLRMIDRPRQQVMLTAIIAEVRLSDSLEYGVEYFLRAFEEEGLGIMELAGGVSDLITGTPTGSAFFTGADGFVIIQALERVSDVTILQQPYAVTRDGVEAVLQVGGETPINTGTLNTDTGAIASSIQYRETGINLTIRPDVNESGDVTLSITQDITNVLGQTDLGPEFVTRKLDTSVTVPHGGTLLLGGIIDAGVTQSARKIPILADTPLLGPAFQSKVDTKTRNELLLAITPTIVNSPSDGHRTMSEFLRAARGVQRALYTSMEDLPAGSLAPGASTEPSVRTAPPPAPEEIEVPGELQELMPELREHEEGGRRSEAPTNEEPEPLAMWSPGGAPWIIAARGPLGAPAFPTW